MPGQLGDVLYIETFDGNELYFGGEDIKLLAYGQFGAAPTSFITRRGYNQDGVTEIDYLLDPRTITVTLWHSATCDRQAYWDARHELHEFLRPNRNGPIRFVLRTPNGDLRSLVVRADPGLVLNPAATASPAWDIQEELDFIANDPLWEDAAATVLALSTATLTQLVFPITFPIIFGVSGTVLTTGTITYLGTWKSYPTITLTGPYTRATIRNLATNVSIMLSVAITAAQQRIITLTPGNQSIVDQNGVNRFSDLGLGSDLINFNLRPDPEVTDGEQEIEIQMIDGTADSAASLTYRSKYFAL